MMPLKAILLGLALAAGLVSGTPTHDALPTWDDFEGKIAQLAHPADSSLSGEHLERVKRGLPRLRDLFQQKAAARQGDGINVAFSFPFDSLGEILINLAPFGSLGVLTYSAVRDIQMQKQLDEYKDRVSALEGVDPVAIKGRLDNICTTVNAITSAVACKDDGTTCQTTVDMDKVTNAAGAEDDRDVARNYMAALMAIDAPTCT